MLVVFTGPGTMNGERWERNAIVADAEAHGHRVQNTIYNTTDVVISAGTNTNKARRARELGVPVITYDQWDQVKTQNRYIPTGSGESFGRLTGRRNTAPTGNPILIVRAPMIDVAEEIVSQKPPVPSAPAMSPLVSTGRRLLDLDDD